MKNYLSALRIYDHIKKKLNNCNFEPNFTISRKLYVYNVNFMSAMRKINCALGNNKYKIKNIKLQLHVIRLF